MIKIYFDGVLIDDDYYNNITNDFQLFDEEFRLGTTSSNTFNIEVPYKAVTNVPYNVKITIDDVDYANLIVDSFEISDDNMLKLELVDKMVLFNYNYDMSVIVPCTILEVLQNICASVGVELGTTEFPNSDVLVNSYDNTITAREYLGYIAEVAGGYAQIGKDGKLYLKTFNDVKATIDIDDCEEFKVREHHKIERVVFDNGLLKYQTSEDEELETLYLNSENPFIDSEDIFNNIVENILNFEFYCFETDNCPIADIIAGDLIKFTEGENEYVTIAQYSLDFNGNWIGGYSLSLNSKQQQETQQTGVSTKIKGISVRMDKAEAEMEIVAEEIGDRTSKSTSITQDLDSISERVSLQQNLTNIVKKSSYVDTEDAYEGNLLYLSIHGQMSLLYPSDDLYPEDDLYPLDSYLIIEYSDNTRQKVKLPINWLNYLDDNTYDEFVLEENKAKIIRRVGENEDGSFYKLDTEVIEDYGDLVISVKTGYNKLWLESFYDLELNYEIRYVIKSDYTDTFATEYYVDNSIDINNKGIILEAKSYTDKETQGDALIAKINLDSTGNAKIDASKTIDLNGVDINLTSDNITINSTNFNVDKSGKVTATAGEIGGFNLTSTNFSNDIDGNYEYSYGDLLACHACILDCNEEEFGDAMGSKAFTSYYKNILDTSGDGVLNALDLLQIQKNIFEMYELSKNAKGKLLINSNSPKNCFSILDGNGDYSFQAGTTGATIREINAETIICASPDTYEDNVIIIKGYDGSILCDTLTCNILNQTSLSTVKKNFEKYTGALEEIENIDVYKYNLKSEEDTTKKHLGFVIGNDFNYSKVITNNDDTGVDIYSMTSLCLQAIKEQQQEIEKLKEEINSLKGGK